MVRLSKLLSKCLKKRYREDAKEKDAKSEKRKSNGSSFLIQLPIDLLLVI